MPPISIIPRLAPFFRQGSAGWSTLTRGISTVRMLGVPGIDNGLCTSSDAVTNILRQRLSDVEHCGAFRTAVFNRCTVITFPENALCGKLIDSRGGWVYDASNTIPLEWQQDIISTLAEAADGVAQRTNDTIAVVFPTTYDTGQTTAAGNRIIVNRAIATTGVANTITVDKSMATSVDGMGDVVLAPPDGQGLSLLPVKDLFGDGAGMALGVKICVDVTKPLPYSLNNEFRKPDVLAVSSYKTPFESGWADQSVVIVNDGADAYWKENDNSLSNASGAWAPAEQYSLLGGMVQLTKGSYAANILSAFMSYFSFDASRFSRTVQTKIGGNIVHVLDGGRGEVLESATVSVPATLEETKLDTVISDIMSTRIILLDDEGEAYDAGQPADQVNVGDPPPPADEEAAEGPGAKLVRQRVALHAAAGPIAVLGALSGPLASLLGTPVSASAAQVAGTTADQSHVLIGSDGVSALGADQRTSAVAALNAGKSVSIVHPATPQTIADLCALLHPSVAPLSFDASGTDIFSVTRSSDGKIHHRTFAKQKHPDADRQAVNFLTTLAPGYNGAASLPTVMTAAPSDNPSDLFNELANLVDHYHVDCPLVPVSLTGANLAQLQQLLQEMKISEAGPVGMTITTTACSLSVQEQNDATDVSDYYFLSQDLMLSPESAQLTSVLPIVGPYVATYGVVVAPTEDASGLGFTPAYVQPVAGSLLLKSAPDTTQGSETFSSSISESIDGNIGCFGEAATGGLSGGVTLENSKSFTVPDVTLFNQSNSSQAAYTFALNPDGAVAKHTFQPSVQHLFQFVDPKTLSAARSGDADKGDTAPVAAFSTTLSVVLWGAASMIFAPLPLLYSGTCTRKVLVRMPPLPEM